MEHTNWIFLIYTLISRSILNDPIFVDPFNVCLLLYIYLLKLLLSNIDDSNTHISLATEKNYHIKSLQLLLKFFDLCICTSIYSLLSALLCVFCNKNWTLSLQSLILKNCLTTGTIFSENRRLKVSATARTTEPLR